MDIINGRNEVVAKVIFLHLSVILFTGGGMSEAEPPLGADTTPPSRHSPRADPPGADPQVRHPQVRHPPEQTPPWEQTPPLHQTPPGADPPPRKQTPAYGQRAAGTHSTGMHSCFKYNS